MRRSTKSGESGQSSHGIIIFIRLWHSTRPLLCSGPAKHSWVFGGVFYFDPQNKRRHGMWSNEGDRWRLACRTMQASFDVNNAAGGLFDLTIEGTQLATTRILQCHNASAGAEIDDTLIDHYVREDDLVATYLQSPAKVNRKQVYLRPAGFLFSEPILGIELVFSMQTQRLDADPQLVIRSEFPSSTIHALVNHDSPSWERLTLPDDALDLAANRFCGAFAAEIKGTDITFAQILDPSDYSGGRLVRTSESLDQFALSQPVFCMTLEKGVIRRGRVTAIFVRGGDALDTVARFFHWYRTSTAQLTT